MQQVQFYDARNKVWYLVFLPSNWTWEYFENLMIRKGYDPTHCQLSHRISLFDGDLWGVEGDIYVKSR